MMSPAELSPRFYTYLHYIDTAYNCNSQNRVSIRSLNSYEDAIDVLQAMIESYQDAVKWDIYSGEDPEPRVYQPIIITNDIRLYSVYSHVFSLPDFKMFLKVDFDYHRCLKNYEWEFLLMEFKSNYHGIGDKLYELVQEVFDNNQRINISMTFETTYDLPDENGNIYSMTSFNRWKTSVLSDPFDILFEVVNIEKDKVYMRTNTALQYLFAVEFNDDKGVKLGDKISINVDNYYFSSSREDCDFYMEKINENRFLPF